MQYYEKHFNTHHLLHKPHKWFLAFLASPIHFLEMHYKKKYHLNFTHAKKLFIFDMTLLLSIIILFSATIFWFNYDPTITKLVYLDIKSSESRIASGDYVEYQIIYKNENDLPLLSPTLRLNLPNGFVLNDVKPNENFDNNTFILDTIAPNTTGGVLIAGWLYGTPDKEDSISATLSYRQESRKKYEEKSRKSIHILRGSVLETNVDSRQIILKKDTLPLELTIKNTGTEILKNIKLPLPQSEYFNFTDLENNIWNIDSLSPSKELNQKLTLNVDTYNQNLTNLSLSFVPIININGIDIPQNIQTQNLTIAEPNLDMSVYWQDNVSKIKPNSFANLIITAKNIGNVLLSNTELNLPIPNSIIDTSKLISLNGGNYKNENFNLKIDDWSIGETKEIILKIPIKNFPTGGNDLVLSLTPSLDSTIAEIANSQYSQKLESQKINIAGQLLLDTEIRYYTNEGDQLGRGPLPPQIDKETKYWTLLTLSNGASKMNDINVTAKLPQNIIWTGKTSVTRGSDITHNPANHTATWQTNSLSTYEKIGINFEISLTPDENLRGFTPNLIENITIKATDSYTGEQIETSTGAQDTNLESDPIAIKKGSEVQ